MSFIDSVPATSRLIAAARDDMDFTYRIDKANRIVYLEGDDPPLELWRQTMLAVFADPEFETGFNFLSDRRAAVEARSSDYLRAALNFIKYYEKEMGDCKWATVVSTMAAFGMGRMTQILAEKLRVQIEVFKDIDEAKDWLMRA
jgi:hypothetical protein